MISERTSFQSLKMNNIQQFDLLESWYTKQTFLVSYPNGNLDLLFLKLTTLLVHSNPNATIDFKGKPKILLTGFTKTLIIEHLHNTMLSDLASLFSTCKVWLVTRHNIKMFKC